MTTPLAFPDNIVVEFKTALAALPGIHSVSARPLRVNDPNACAGVYAMDWMPGEYGIGQYDPFLCRYAVNIQLLVKHMQEEEARAQHSVLSKSIRVMVYRDAGLRIRLPQLSETSSGVTEKLSRWNVKAQRFLSNEVQGQFLFLSTTEVTVECELN